MLRKRSGALCELSFHDPVAAAGSGCACAWGTEVGRSAPGNSAHRPVPERRGPLTDRGRLDSAILQGPTFRLSSPLAIPESPDMHPDVGIRRILSVRGRKRWRVCGTHLDSPAACQSLLQGFQVLGSARSVREATRGRLQWSERIRAFRARIAVRSDASSHLSVSGCKAGIAPNQRHAPRATAGRNALLLFTQQTGPARTMAQA
jgi:hypothetical protein